MFNIHYCYIVWFILYLTQLHYLYLNINSKHIQLVYILNLKLKLILKSIFRATKLKFKF
jgi:hypothetical protein